MNQRPIESTDPLSRTTVDPVLALRDELAQTMAAVDQLRSILGDGRRPRTQGSVSTDERA